MVIMMMMIIIIMDDHHHQSSELSFFYRVWKEWEIVGNQFTSMLMTDGEPCIGPLSRAIKVNSESLSFLLQTLGGYSQRTFELRGNGGRQSR